MFHFITDHATYLALAGPEYNEEYGSPCYFPCIGYRIEHRSRPGFSVWSFLYLTDLAFTHMLVAYLGSAECPDCADDQVILTKVVSTTFDYGIGTDAVELQCSLPVRKCDKCGALFVDHAGENIRDATVAEHRRAVESATNGSKAP